jgi:hypothetical protein
MVLSNYVCFTLRCQCAIADLSRAAVCVTTAPQKPATAQCCCWCHLAPHPASPAAFWPHIHTPTHVSGHLLRIQVAKNCDVVFVSVKPQYVHTVLTEARPVLKEDTLVISIAAGITVQQLLEAAGPSARVCRVMPNTPCLVGETAAAMCLGGKVRAEQSRLSAVEGICGVMPLGRSVLCHFRSYGHKLVHALRL